MSVPNNLKKKEIHQIIHTRHDTSNFYSIRQWNKKWKLPKIIRYITEIEISSHDEKRVQRMMSNTSNVFVSRLHQNCVDIFMPTPKRILWLYDTLLLAWQDTFLSTVCSLLVSRNWNCITTSHISANTQGNQVLLYNC